MDFHLLRSGWQLPDYIDGTLAILDKLCPKLGGQVCRKASILCFRIDHSVLGFCNILDIFLWKLAIKAHIRELENKVSEAEGGSEIQG